MGISQNSMFGFCRYLSSYQQSALKYFFNTLQTTVYMKTA